MANDKLNTDDLQKEKLLLEIEELKNKVAHSKKSKAWDEYVKPIIPVAVTLIIAIFGWIITGQFNKAQLRITESKNKADKEIAQINASLSFIRLMREIPDSLIQLRQQAKTVIAPALPPETSFYIAIEDLPINAYVLDVLIRTYKENYWKYLMPYLEVYPPYFKSDPFRKPLNDLPLFGFLDRRQLFNSFYQFLCSESYNSPNRVFALINYFDYLYEKEDLGGNPTKNNEIKYQLLSTIERKSDSKLKADISKAASIVLDQFNSQYFYSQLAAKYYWENFDVSRGEIPRGESIEEFIYSERFQVEHPVPGKPNYHIELPAVDSLSQSLFSKLSKLNFNSFEVDRINVILYSYCESIKKEPFTPYLKQKHSLQLVEKILQSLATEKRRQEFSMHLGSHSGDILFRNISQDKEAGKKYSEMLISWYERYWKKDWYIPKFFHNVVSEYPELKSKIDKKWGVGTE
jgi:hypothetical protein